MISAFLGTPNARTSPRGSTTLWGKNRTLRVVACNSNIMHHQHACMADLVWHLRRQVVLPSMEVANVLHQ